MSSKDNVLILVAVVGALILFGFVSGMFDGVYFAITDTVLVPQIGYLWCIEGGQQNVTSLNAVGSSNTYPMNANMWGGLPTHTQVYFSEDIFEQTNHAGWNTKNFSCQGYECKLQNINIHSFSCIADQFSSVPLWIVKKNGQTIEQAQKSNDWTDSNPVIVDSNPNDIILNDNDSITLYSTCVGSVLFQGQSVSKPSQQISLLQKKKMLTLFADGTSNPIANSDGCLKQHLLNYTTNEPLNETFFDSVWSSVNQVVSADSVSNPVGGFFDGQVVLTNDFPDQSMGINTAIPIVYGWKPISGYNKITITEGVHSGKIVVALPSHDVFLVEDIQTEGGRYSIAGTQFADDVGCISSGECPSNRPTCKTSDGSFVCVASAIEDCYVDADCGTNFFTSVNNQPVYASFQCVNGECQRTNEPRFCIPVPYASGSPANYCPSSSPVCVNGLYCQSEAIVKSNCPSGSCCTEVSKIYYVKNCADGLFCDADETGIGWCRTIPAQCGNNVINAGELCDGTNLAGKSCSQWDSSWTGILSCKDDCSGFITDKCDVSAQDCKFWEQYREAEEPVWWTGGLLKNDVSQCVTADWVYLGVFFLFSIIALFIFFGGKKK